MANGKNWVFTTNNPVPENSPDQAKWKALVQYCTWQVEKGEAGVLHIQGYAQFKAKIRLTALKKLESRAHWEPRRGSHEQARDYCRKEDTRVYGPFTYGEEVKQGQRTDLESMAQLMLELPETDVSLVSTATYVRYYKGLRAFKTLHSKPRTHKTLVEIWYGPAGTGKTMQALERFPDAYWKTKGEWWDDYDGQATVIIDEFYGWIPFDLLCRLCDRYPLKVPTKGGFTNFIAKRIIFTSNKHPQDWYDLTKVTWLALKRRVEKVMFLPVLGVAPMEELLDDTPNVPHLTRPYN